MSYQYLTKMLKSALHNAARQRRKIKDGKRIKIPPEHWDKVANSYRADIKALHAKQS